MQKNGIDLSEEGYQGTWYVIDEGYHEGEKVYLLESEDYGPSNPWDAPGMKISDFI